MNVINNYYSSGEIEIIKSKRVTILGLGGLGCSVVNHLARLGIGHLSIIDFDTFNTGNLNRQLFANIETIGRKKVEVVYKEIKKINSEIDVKIFGKKFDDTNALEILNNSDIAIDCFDNIESRIVALNTCRSLNIPFIFGSVGGVYGYVSLINDYKKLNIMDLFQKLNTLDDNSKITTSFSVSVISSIQVSECVKYVLNKRLESFNKIITIDLENNNLKMLTI